MRAPLLALLLPSCVATTGDLERIHTRLESMEVAVESGDCAAVQSALAATKQEVEVVAREVSERGLSIVEVGLALAAQVLTGYSAYRVTMNKRDHARVLRDERVDVPKARSS